MDRRLQTKSVVHVVRSVLSARGMCYVDLGPKSAMPTPLGMAMYYDFEPGITHALIGKGAAIMWWEEDRKQVCPLRMAAHQGNWRQLYLGLRMPTSDISADVQRWSRILNDLADDLYETSCMPCTMESSAERCCRCLHDRPHSPHVSFELCVDVLVYSGLRSFLAHAPHATSPAPRRAATQLDERFRCRLAEVRAVNFRFLGQVLEGNRAGVRPYLDGLVARQEMEQPVHDVLCQWLASGELTVAQLMQTWRPRVLAALDQLRTSGGTARYACVACEAPAARNDGLCDADGKRVRACTRCLSAWYCSAECQKSHWPIHKRVCNKPWADTDAVWTAARAYDCCVLEPPPPNEQGEGATCGRCK
jgi:hypothetical protein